MYNEYKYTSFDKIDHELVIASFLLFNRIFLLVKREFKIIDSLLVGFLHLFFGSGDNGLTFGNVLVFEETDDLSVFLLLPDLESLLQTLQLLAFIGDALLHRLDVGHQARDFLLTVLLLLVHAGVEIG